MLRLVSALAIGVSLMMPVSFVNAQEHHKHHHEWTEQEKMHWQEWEKEHHKKDREWDKATKKEHSSYWHWRDKHPD
jgi:hypothetical protein